MVVGLSLPASASLVGTTFSYESRTHNGANLIGSGSIDGGFIPIANGGTNFLITTLESALQIRYFGFDPTGAPLSTDFVDPYSVRFFNLNWGDELGSIISAEITTNTTDDIATLSNVLGDEFTLNFVSGGFDVGWQFNDLVEVTLTVDHTPIPLPGALPLFLTAMAGIGLLARRRMKAAQR